MQSRELREQRKKLVDEARRVMQPAIDETRGMTAEEQAKYDAIDADVDRLAATIDRLEKVEGAERAFVPESQREQAIVSPADVQAQYRESFWSYIKGRSSAQELRAMSVATDTYGGYTVPDEFRRQLVVAMDELNVMRGLATVITSNSGTMTLPTLTTHASAAWKAEVAAYAETTPVFGEVTFSAHKATCLVKVSEELLNDSAFPLESYLAREFGRRLGKLEEEAFINGTGSNQPTGLFGGATVGTTASATNAITVDELTDLYYSLGRAYRQRATWIMKDSTVKLIRKLKTGVSSDNTYLWQAGLREGEPDMLLGRPVKVSEFAPAATTGLRAVAFGDISYYYIGDRQAITMQRLVELYAGTGHIGFRQFKRTDGKLSLATAVNALIMA
jgi:HK97 family phage major capsid protein